MKYPPQKCLAIDVDNTLVIDGKLTQTVVDFAISKRAEGFDVILWSARGRKHAEDQAMRFGIKSVFTAILSKPGYIIDDIGWSWIKFTKWIRGSEIQNVKQESTKASV
jgi:hydroxymethylpyrimidine pyrophosphatase-like HAD family hydrolase